MARCPNSSCNRLISYLAFIFHFSNWDRPSERETEEKWENKDNFSVRFDCVALLFKYTNNYFTSIRDMKNTFFFLCFGL